MKRIKAWTSLLLALVMALSLSVSALAANIDLSKNAITVNNVKAGATYNLYKMMDLESYNTESGAYAYKVNSAWADFFTNSGAGASYVNIDSQGYVTWKSDKQDATSMEAFGKAADKYASGNNLTPVNTATVAGFEKAVIFGALEPGYYLITSTVGTKVIVETTPDKKAVVVNDKNEQPTIVKQVKEDSTGNFGKTNDADIGQTVEFQSTITAQAGAENYKFHDKMTEGLTYGSVTGITLNDSTVDARYYTVKTTELSDDCTFEIVFTQDFCDTLKANDKIVISYTATVNENAVVGLNGNANDSVLEYGEEGKSSKTPKSETITYTWDLDILKYANGDESKVLSGAQFVLLNSAKTKVATVVNGKLTGWADVPTEGQDWPANTVLTTGENGKIEIDGLDADTYYLREIKAPDGYNKLTNDIEVKITGATKGEGDTLTYTTVVAKVNNQSGTELPSTGGMGTTLFYALGGVLVLAAVVLLVTRKRMSSKG